mgnify:CR=1 FL=1
MKQSQLKQIIRQLIKEQIGTASGGPNPATIHCIQGTNTAGCVTIFATGPGSLSDYLTLNPGTESVGTYDDMPSCQAACIPSTEATGPSSCCEYIQALKPYIPVVKKQFYLDALEGCGCNQASISSVSRRR